MLECGKGIGHRGMYVPGYDPGSPLEAIVRTASSSQTEATQNGAEWRWDSFSSSFGSLLDIFQTFQDGGVGSKITGLPSMHP